MELDDAPVQVMVVQDVEQIETFKNSDLENSLTLKAR